MATNLASLIKRALLPKRRRDFVRDERGVTAVEFGILAVPFFSIIGAILETSLVFLSGQILDSAVQDSGRLLRTGQVQAANYTPAKFREYVCGRLYGLFNCSNLFVEVQVLTSFNAATIKPPVDYSCKTQDECKWNRPEAYSPGAGSSIVVVQVYYKWPIMLNFGSLLANLGTGEHLLGAATVFRNEPFS
ncbi:Flp pilus assembly protein TadG [Devosia sp. YR412]|uniref:TadE/TadG family type IV pilus assembly protein n=1 Tax=Devosia sp. YR412 TaxID=1881030 RepID=UPI0008BFC122|nr:TadE/TadG family type IV pilus assembly protein [Devosia sp. YR412]SEP69907.1 Flp pilus assembly protein TadG [Devosia sp. YR412]